MLPLGTAQEGGWFLQKRIIHLNRHAAILTFQIMQSIFNRTGTPELKRAIIFLALLSLAYGSFALEFRNTSWLMTREEVIASETGRIVSELSLPGQEQIVFQALVNGFTATITYILENDKLLSASYTFKKDVDRNAFASMKKDLINQNGPPAFEREDLIGWRLEKTEIALAHLPDGTSYAAYWEKAYFARINNLSGTSSATRRSP